jgi:tripartite ATP-independent transporter DctP family solute receptor
MKMLRIIIPAVILSVLTTTSVFAAPLELKFGHVGKPGSLFEASANEFAMRANAKLGDKAKVVVFEKEIVWPTLEPILEQKGYKVLAIWENGFRNITNNKRPINKPEDLQDLKLRTPKSVWRVKMFKAYGANPSPLSFSEVFVALQTGTFDGQENPLAQIASGKFQEVQKYLSMTGHVYTPAYVTVSTGHWSKLPADVREILEATAKETQDYVYKTAAKMEVDLLAQLKAGGIKVNNADKTAFIKASAPIYEEFGSSVPNGKMLIDKALGLAK